jgi:hypothetical protein
MDRQHPLDRLLLPRSHRRTFVPNHTPLVASPGSAALPRAALLHLSSHVSLVASDSPTPLAH